jgi:N2-acetyl-L-2,4-diaminobutanoate deacetylase
MKPSTSALAEWRIAVPSQIDLDSPGRRDYLVALEHDSIWGDHLIPLTVFVGARAKAGEGLVAFGANHGNEYEGPIAIKKLLGEIRIEEVLGRIILMPVLNVSAFAAGTRESENEDGVNMNRAFVAQAGQTPSVGTITYRIAAFVRTFIWPRVHVVLDLHSGGDVAKFAPCACYHEVADRDQARVIEDTARLFGTPWLMLYQGGTPGLLTGEAEKMGKIAVGTELGWGCSVNRSGVERARIGILAAALKYGQLDRSCPDHGVAAQRVVTIADRSSVVVSPQAGHFEPLVECGEMVEAGQILGLLHDFSRLDETPWPAIAALDGVLMAHAWKAPVARGQHIAVVGRIVG